MCSAISNYQTFGLTNQLADWAIFKREKKTVVDVAKLVVSAALAALALIPTFLIDCVLTATTKIYSLMCKRSPPPTPPLTVSDSIKTQAKTLILNSGLGTHKFDIQKETGRALALMQGLHQLLLPTDPPPTHLTPSWVALLETGRQIKSRQAASAECEEMGNLLRSTSDEDGIFWLLQLSVPSRTIQMPEKARAIVQKLGELSTSIIQNSPKKTELEAVLRA